MNWLYSVSYSNYYGNWDVNDGMNYDFDDGYSNVGVGVVVNIAGL